MSPLDRWIPLLGLSAVLLAGLGSRPQFQPTIGVLALHVALLVGSLAAGIAALLHRRLPPRLLPLPAFAALGIFFLQLLNDTLRASPFANVLHFVGTLGYVLQFAGTPLLWGLALSRREDPGQERTQRYGRMAAGIVQLAFVFLFVAEVQELARFSSRDLTSGTSFYTGLRALERVVRTAESVLLLWASVLCMRTTAEPSRIQEWAGRIHRLTFASFGAGMLSQGISTVAYPGAEEANQVFPLPWAWRAVLVSVLTLLAAFTLPPCFRTPPPGYNSALEPHP